jgi:hypothetical protein
VQYQTPEHEIQKRSFLTDCLELALVLGVALYPETGREDELTDSRGEAGEEGVEGLERSLVSIGSRNTDEKRPKP